MIDKHAQQSTAAPDIIARLNDACVGHPAALIPWPHRLLHDARDEIERLRAALANPPTDAMIRAALDEPQAGDENMYHRIWRAMAREAANAER